MWQESDMPKNNLNPQLQGTICSAGFFYSFLFLLFIYF